jgi:hypothetical protein
VPAIGKQDFHTNCHPKIKGIGYFVEFSRLKLGIKKNMQD